MIKASEKSAKKNAEYRKILLKNREKKKVFYAMNKGNLMDTIQIIKMAIFLDKIVPRDKSIIFVCIGTSRIPGDCLGPSVGYLLDRASDCITVYGTPNKNVNAVNINDFAAMFRTTHKDDFIIAIDAAISKKTRAGSVVVCDQPVEPAAAAMKATGLANIGDASILAITSSLYEDTIALGPGEKMIKAMPDFIARTILFYIQYIRKERIFSTDINSERKPYYKKNEVFVACDKAPQNNYLPAFRGGKE